MNRGDIGSPPAAPSRLVDDTVAVVLAGGKGTRLGALTRRECKPALPFGGAYRTIDFSLSNCVNSGIHRVGVATQYRDQSLVGHIERAWQSTMDRSQGFIEPWRADALASRAGYSGTADAVFQNWGRINALDPKRVLILAGDHVYKMDYRTMLERHANSGAEVTVGCVEVPITEASQFGVMSIDDTHRIVRFAEKPRDPEPLPDCPDRVLGSMGIYVFDRDVLAQVLAEDAQIEGSSHDFGRDLIPRLIGKAKVLAYPFNQQASVGGGYWRDVGTVAAYWRTHMELLAGIPGFDLNDTDWPVRPGHGHSHQPPRHAWRLDWPGRVDNCLLAERCRFEQATLRHTVLFANATVAPNTVLENAVILPDAVIGRYCRLSGVVVDAGVRVPDGTVIDATRGNEARAPMLITAETNFRDFASGTARSMLGRRHRRGVVADRYLTKTQDTTDGMDTTKVAETDFHADSNAANSERRASC